MNNFGTWYFIIAAITCFLLVVYLSKNSKNFIEDVAGPAFLMSVMWPLLILTGLIALLAAIAFTPLYIVYLITKFVINKGRR
jgi:hypothetical protein